MTMRQNEIKETKREEWIDYARICAICCVVLCHATQEYYNGVLNGTEHVRFLFWGIETTFFTIGRLGVPIFLAISGTLLLNREKNIFRFYRKSLIPMIVATEIWTVFNYFFVCIVYEREIVLPDLIKEMLFMKDGELSHMWYMPMIIGMYVFIPFLAKVINYYENIKYFIIPITIVWIDTMLIPTINVFYNRTIMQDESLETLVFLPDVNFGGGAYGLYIILGYFIGRKKLLQRVKTSILLIVSAVLFAANTAGQYYLYSNDYFSSGSMLWYNIVPIFALGLTLYELIRRYHNVIKHIVRIDMAFLARCSFGIYLLHKPVMVLWSKYVPLSGVNVILKIILLFIAGVGISLIILLPFYLKWKRVGKIVFLIK